MTFILVQKIIIHGMFSIRKAKCCLTEQHVLIKSSQLSFIQASHSSAIRATYLEMDHTSLTLFRTLNI